MLALYLRIYPRGRYWHQASDTVYIGRSDPPLRSVCGRLMGASWDHATRPDADPPTPLCKECKRRAIKQVEVKA